MINPIRSLPLLLASLLAGLAVSASAAVNVATVDLNRAYAEYWKTQQQVGKWMERSTDAQEQADELQKRLEAIANEGKQLQQDAQNTALTEEARSRIAGDAQRKFQEFQEMQERLRQFADNTERQMQMERRNFTELMLQEIRTIVVNLAKDRGANFVVDVSGKTMNGVSSILYADPTFDVTDAVIAELNKSKPADFQPPALPAQE
jgi:outer membrane protein